LITCDEKKIEKAVRKFIHFADFDDSARLLEKCMISLAVLNPQLTTCVKKHWRCWKIEKKASSFRRPSKVQGIDGQGFAALWQLPLA